MNNKRTKCKSYKGTMFALLTTLMVICVAGCAKEKKDTTKKNDVENAAINMENSVWYYVTDYDIEKYQFKDKFVYVAYTNLWDSAQDRNKQFTYKVSDGKMTTDAFTYSEKIMDMTLTEEKMILGYEMVEGEDYMDWETEGVEDWNSYKEIVCYPTLEEAIEYAIETNEGYKTTPHYLKTVQDEDGWVIEDDLLIRYMGDAKEVRVPENVTVIEDCAFSGDMGTGTENLEKVIVGNNVKKINGGAFSFTNADIIIIEDGVEEIGDMCFMDSYIDDIYIPESVTKIGGGILETEEGLDGTKVHCVEGSAIDKYLKENPPYGGVDVVYDYDSIK